MAQSSGLVYTVKMNLNLKHKKAFFPVLTLAFLTAAFFSSCSQKPAQEYSSVFLPQHQKLNYRPFVFNRVDTAVEDYISSIGEVQAVSQLFLVNIEGNTSYHAVETQSDVDSRYSQEPLIPGGMLFFSYNVSDSAQKVMEFTSSIRNFCLDKQIVPPYIAIDQEGGVVNRLSGITSGFPSNKRMAEKTGLYLAMNIYSTQARQMKALGFDLNLSPVAEAACQFNSDFLGTRSFGSIENTVDFSSAQIQEFQNQGVSSCVKHFPGNTNADPHSLLPEINLSKDEFNSQLLTPFKTVLEMNPHAVLMSHVKVNVSDSNMGQDSQGNILPACLSSYWVQQVLKEQLGFKGLVISDDIFMAALEKNGYPPEKAVVMAIDAGVHVIMLSEKRFALAASYLLDKADQDPEFRQKLLEAEKKVIYYKIASGILKPSRNASGDYVIVPAASPDLTARKEEFNKAWQDGVEAYSKAFN